MHRYKRSISNIARTKGSCLCGKNRYQTENEAQLALATCRGSASSRRRELRIYWCRLCFGYHLTSHENRVARLISDEEYKTCVCLIKSSGDRIAGVVDRLFRLIGVRSNKALWAIALAGVHCLREAGLPKERISDVWVWRVLRLVYDPDGRDFAHLLERFTEASRALADEYAADHEQWAAQGAAECLAVTYGERQWACDAAVRDWVIRAARRVALTLAA